MREILSDLVAEQQSLDQVLQRLPIREWKRPTPAPGWDIRDTVSHLAAAGEYAFNALEEGGTRLTGKGQPEEFAQAGVERGRSMRPQDVLEWWRASRARVVEALSRRRPNDLIPWFSGEVSCRSFAAAQLTETWAHGLDAYRAMEMEMEGTPRLRHVAGLAWETLPRAFARAGQVYRHPVRLEVMGPAYAKWVFGPENGEQVIKGAAGEWCRLAVGRMKLADAATLRATGAVAEKALSLVDVFA